MFPRLLSSLEIATWLLTYLLHSTIILGGALLLSRVIRREIVRALLWKTALFGAIATTAIQMVAGNTSFVIPLVIVQERTHSAPLRADNALAGSEPNSTASNANQPGGNNAGSTSANAIKPPAPNFKPAPFPVASAPAAELPANDQTDIRFSSFNVHVPPTGAAEVRTEWRATLPGATRWSGAVLFIWIAIAAILLFRVARRYQALRSALHDRVPVTDAYLMTTFAELTRAAQVGKPVALSVSARCVSPMVLRRFEICLPARFLKELDREQQQAALAHEVAHIAHGDRAWSLISSLFQAVFFLQPLHAVLRTRMRATSEVLADDWAVDQTGSRLELARCLVHVAEWIAVDGRHLNAVAVAMAETGSPLVARIERLLGDRRRERAPTPVRTVVVVAGILLLVAWSAPRVSCDCGQPSPQMSSNAPVVSQPEALAESASDSAAQLLTTTMDPGFRRVDGVGGCTLENSPSQGLAAMKNSSVQSIGIAVASGLFAACGGSPDNVPEVVRSDSSGIAIVETRMTVEMRNPIPWIAPAPQLKIGQVAGDPRYELSDIRGLVRTDDGTIVVADNGSVKLKFFSAAGQFLKEVGGKGDGPGEARRFIRVQRCGEGLILARDWSGPASWWTTSGELVSRAKFALPAGRDPRAARTVGGISTPLYYSCSPNGKIIMTSWGDPTREPMVESLKERTAATYATWSKLWLVDTAGAVLLEMPDTIIAERIVSHSSGGGGGSGPHMFGRNISFAMDSNRLFMSYGDRPQVAIYSFDGKLRGIWRAPAEDLTLTESMIKQYQTASLSPADSATRRRYTQYEFKMPATYPAFDELHLTHDGFLWARRFRLPWETDVRWGLFGPDGSFLGYTTFPRGLEVFEIGSDYVLGVAKDSLDVPFVQLHRINRGTEGKQ